jgi:hypothetical protein
MAFSVFEVLNAATVPQKVPQCRFAFHIRLAPQFSLFDRQNVCLRGAAFQMPEQTPDGPLPAQVPLP